MPDDKPPGTEPGASKARSNAPSAPRRRPGESGIVSLDGFRSQARRSTGPRTRKAPRRREPIELGLFTRSMLPAAGLLKERPEELRSLVASLRLRYAPRGGEEALIVDSMAALWWRLARLKRFAAEDPRKGPAPGAKPTAARSKGPSVAVAQKRLEQSLSRMHKDLEFLQRMRGAATPPREP